MNHMQNVLVDAEIQDKDQPQMEEIQRTIMSETTPEESTGNIKDLLIEQIEDIEH